MLQAHQHTIVKQLLSNKITIVNHLDDRGNSALSLALAGNCEICTSLLLACPGINLSLACKATTGPSPMPSPLSAALKSGRFAVVARLLDAMSARQCTVPQGVLLEAVQGAGRGLVPMLVPLARNERLCGPLRAAVVASHRPTAEILAAAMLQRWWRRHHLRSSLRRLRQCAIAMQVRVRLSAARRRARQARRAAVAGLHQARAVYAAAPADLARLCADIDINSSAFIATVSPTADPRAAVVHASCCGYPAHPRHRHGPLLHYWYQRDPAGCAVLLDHGANPALHRDAQGNTLLHSLAAQGTDAAFVTTLVKRCLILPELANTEGLFPADTAVRSAQPAMLELLVSLSPPSPARVQQLYLHAVGALHQGCTALLCRLFPLSSQHPETVTAVARGALAAGPAALEVLAAHGWDVTADCVRVALECSPSPTVLGSVAFVIGRLESSYANAAEVKRTFVAAAKFGVQLLDVLVGFVVAATGVALASGALCEVSALAARCLGLDDDQVFSAATKCAAGPLVHEYLFTKGCGFVLDRLSQALLLCEQHRDSITRLRIVDIAATRAAAAASSGARSPLSLSDHCLLLRWLPAQHALREHIIDRLETQLRAPAPTHLVGRASPACGRFVEDMQELRLVPDTRLAAIGWQQLLRAAARCEHGLNALHKCIEALDLPLRSARGAPEDGCGPAAAATTIAEIPGAQDAAMPGHASLALSPAAAAAQPPQQQSACNSSGHSADLTFGSHLPQASFTELSVPSSSTDATTNATTTLVSTTLVSSQALAAWEILHPLLADKKEGLTAIVCEFFGPTNSSSIRRTVVDLLQLVLGIDMPATESIRLSLARGSGPGLMLRAARVSSQASLLAFLRANIPEALQCGICGEAAALLPVQRSSGSEHFRKVACVHEYCGACLSAWVASRVDDRAMHIPCPSSNCK